MKKKLVIEPDVMILHEKNLVDEESVKLQGGWASGCQG